MFMYKDVAQNNILEYTFYIYIYIYIYIYVTGLKFGLWKTQHGSCVVEENSWWGHQ